ncbi:MAG TPA: DNA-directed RNA polymerase subunit omega [Acidobacteriota bacterium]
MQDNVQRMEKCLDAVPNRFILATVTALRAEQLMAGAPALVEMPARSKPTTVALGEVAQGKLDFVLGESAATPESEEEK